MATNYFLNQYFTTTLNVGGGIDASQTTGIIVQAVSGLDITKPGVACITYADPINTSTAEWVTYTSIDGSNELQGVTRGAEGFGAKTHSNGAVIAFPLSESHINTLATALSIGGVATNGVTTTLDEDDMASNSATALATQQSIKAYVDTKDAALLIDEDTFATNTDTKAPTQQSAKAFINNYLKGSTTGLKIQIGETATSGSISAGAASTVAATFASAFASGTPIVIGIANGVTGHGKWLASYSTANTTGVTFNVYNQDASTSGTVKVFYIAVGVA